MDIYEIIGIINEEKNLYSLFYTCSDEIVLMNFGPLKNASINATATITTINLNSNKSPVASPVLLLVMKTNIIFL